MCAASRRHTPGSSVSGGCSEPKRIWRCSSARRITASRKKTARRCTAGSTEWRGFPQIPKSRSLTIEADETLLCAPNGQVASLGSKPIFEFTAEKANALASARPEISGRRLRAAIRQKLRLQERSGAPYARILRPRGERGYPKPHAACYAVETEPALRRWFTDFPTSGSCLGLPAEKDAPCSISRITRPTGKCAMSRWSAS